MKRFRKGSIFLSMKININHIILMEFYPKDDLDTCVENEDLESEIQKMYSGSYIFITGATGFMGKILLEKILRSCNVAGVYLLVREKKGKTQAERLQDLLSDVVFERALLENRNARNLITLMNGDCSLPDLGLSEEDRMVLQDQVDFVFHVAATVNMGENLRSAFYININAARCLLELAKTMKTLKAFVYVSTAYSQIMLSTIEEKFYPTEFSPEEMHQIVKDLDDSQLSAITPLIVGKMVNTYSLTKAITEYMITRYHPEIPVTVVRPSIVVSSASEPLVGWIDNANGATGVGAGTLAGLLRVWRSDPDAIADLIPVDVAINTMLAVGWHVAAHRPKPENKIIFNLVSSVKKPITWRDYMYYNEYLAYDETIVTMLAVGCYTFTIIKNETLFWLYTMLFHVVPGLFCDIIMRLARMTPKFLMAYRKVYRMNNTIAPYCTKEFKYVDDNVDEVWSLMNAKDKQLFNFDMNSFTHMQYFRSALRGIRVYLLKDPMDTLKDAQAKYFRIYYVTMFIRGILLGIFGWLIFSLASTVLLRPNVVTETE